MGKLIKIIIIGYNGGALSLSQLKQPVVYIAVVFGRVKLNYDSRFLKAGQQIHTPAAPRPFKHVLAFGEPL